ncbi:MAG: ROK family transcriptional regulator [Patescibacteria group bacterium]
MREHNTLAILDTIRKHGPLTRAETAERSGLSLPTVCRIVDDLVLRGAVLETGKGDSSGGRRPMVLKYDARQAAVVGIFAGDVSIAVALADLDGEIVARTSFPIAEAGLGSAIIARIARAIYDLFSEAGMRLDSLAGIGLALHGTTDPACQVVNEAPFLTGWDNLAVREIFGQAFPVPIVLDNEANLAVLAEHWRGSAKGADNILYITISAGIGGGIMIGGSIYRGNTGRAAEIGFITVGRPARDDKADRLGYLESHYGTEAVVNRIRAELAAGRPSILQAPFAAGGGVLTRAQVWEAARNGDALAREAVLETAEYWGLAIANAAAIVDPELIVVGGDANSIWEVVAEVITNTVGRFIPKSPPIVLSSLGWDAQLYGAIKSVLIKVGYDFVLKPRKPSRHVAGGRNA